LYTDSEEPRWLEHPDHGGAVDVVVLPLFSVDEGIRLFPYDPWEPGPPASFIVTSTLYVVGFPFGTTGGGGLGIWVRGSIATEPELDFEGLPRFLIDSRTRQGQSGSPVITHDQGTAPVPGGMAFFAGSRTRLVGIYSGRINEQSDLGYEWKVPVLTDLLERGVPGVP